MAMAKFTVDTANRLFIAKAGVTSFDIQVDLYSDAKEHWVDGGVPMGMYFPLRTVAGDPTGTGAVEPYYFLGHGWKIRPDEANHTLLGSGNLDLEEGEVGDIFVPTVGGYTVLCRIDTTNRGVLLSGTGADPETIADAVWDEALLGHATAGTAGKALTDVPTQAQNADAVWDELLSGHTGVGTAGKALSDSPTQAQVAAAVWDEALAGHTTSGTSGAVLLLLKHLISNAHTLDPATGILTVFADDGQTPLYQVAVYSDAAKTKLYDGTKAPHAYNGVSP